MKRTILSSMFAIGIIATATLMNSCNKENSNPTPEPVGNAKINSEAAKDGYMILVTEKVVNGQIELHIESEEEDKEKIWIDLNNDGIKQPEEKVEISDNSKKYTLKAQTVTIYGKVTVLYCYNTDLTALDVSHNKALKELGCLNNKLSTLNISQNDALEELYCSSNQLTALDVSQNKKLKQLNCSDNQLSTLNVSHNEELEGLFCSANQLTALDISQNKALDNLYCNINQLKKNAMNAILEALPVRTEDDDANIYIYAEDNPKEGNELPDSAKIQTATSKKWNVYKFKDKFWDLL